jgi:hypothetical protein
VGPHKQVIINFRKTGNAPLVKKLLSVFLQYFLTTIQQERSEIIIFDPSQFNLYLLWRILSRKKSLPKIG